MIYAQFSSGLSFSSFRASFTNDRRRFEGEKENFSHQNDESCQKEINLNFYIVVVVVNNETCVLMKSNKFLFLFACFREELAMKIGLTEARIQVFITSFLIAF